jgi:hypothetical protein
VCVIDLDGEIRRRVDLEVELVVVADEVLMAK